MQENPENDTTNEEAPQEPQNAESPAPTPEVSQNAKNMALLCHLLGFFTNFIGPLIVWLLKKEEDAFIDRQGKEALNFQITVAIAYIVASLLLPVFCIGILLWVATLVINLVFVIMACVKSSKGEDYRYPVSIRLIK